MNSPPNPRRSLVSRKLAWQQRVLRAPNLSDKAKLLGCQLVHDFDERGLAWRSQPSLAELLKMDIRTVRRAMNELRDGGYLHIKVSRGRGRANEYSPIFSNIDDKRPDDEIRAEPASENRANTSVFRTDKRTPAPGLNPEKRTDGAQKADSSARPLPYESKYPPTPRFGRIAAGFPDADIRRRIADTIGEEATAAYLDPATWNPVERQIVCRLGIAAERLGQKAKAALDEMNVRVLHAPYLHGKITSRPLRVVHSAS
jgi:biotin operon repressor